MKNHNGYNSHRAERGGLIRRNARKIAVAAGLLAAGSVVAAGGVQLKHESDHKADLKYDTTQSEIAPVISNAMINIDRQAIAQNKANPQEVQKIEAPDGHQNMVEFTRDAGNVRVIMGKIAEGQPDAGQPDAAHPVYVDYLNNYSTGAGKRGTHVVMTAPEGNWNVDNKDYSDFGGTTKGGSTPEGGWAAAIPGQDDTTDRGYGGDSLPAPVDAAQEIAKATQDYAEPFVPYTYDDQQ